MFRIWPRSENRKLADGRWIPEVTERGWVILAKDGFRKEHERRTIVACGARVFQIPNASLSSVVMTERFLNNGDAIRARCGDPGPFFYSVHSNTLRKMPLP